MFDLVVFTQHQRVTDRQAEGIAESLTRCAYSCCTLCWRSTKKVT